MTIQFYFIISPNNSGTTVMGQYLAEQCGGYLPPFGNFEGQMVPAVRRHMRRDPWNADAAIDWRFVRDEWEKLAREAGTSIFIECSPPNLMRLGAIVDEFADGMKAVITIANPYMQIASCLKNYVKVPLADPEIQAYVEAWLLKARMQKENLRQFGTRFPFLKYEEFCSDPSRLGLGFDLGATSTVAVSGKRNTHIGDIVDLTVKNVAFLTVFEIIRITELLEPHRDLVEYFGYDLLDRAAYSALLSRDMGLAHAGLLDRMRFDMKMHGGVAPKAGWRAGKRPFAAN